MFSPCKTDSFFHNCFFLFYLCTEWYSFWSKNKIQRKMQREKLHKWHTVASLLALSSAFKSDEICTYDISTVCKQYYRFLLNPSFSNSIFVREQKQDTPKDAAWKTLQCGWIIKNKMREKRDPSMSCFPIPLRSLTPTNRSGFENKTCNY